MANVRRRGRFQSDILSLHELTHSVAYRSMAFVPLHPSRSFLERHPIRIPLFPSSNSHDYFP
jgi:hypothetical protein